MKVKHQTEYPKFKFHTKTCFQTSHGLILDRPLLWMTHSSGRFVSVPSAPVLIPVPVLMPVPVLIPVPVLLTLPNPVNIYQPTILQSSPQHLLLPPQLPHHHQAPLRAGLSWLLNDNYWLQFDLLQVLPVVKVGIKPTLILILII